MKFLKWLIAESPSEQSTEKAPDLNEALVRSIELDMLAYPQDWERKPRVRIFFRDWEIRNRKTNIAVTIEQVGENSPIILSINEMKLPGKFADRIQKAFEQREACDILNKLLDRIERAQEIDIEAIKTETNKQNVVNPFCEDNMSRVEENLRLLKEAAVPALPKPKCSTIKSPKPINFTEEPRNTELPKKPIKTYFRGVPLEELSEELRKDFLLHLGDGVYG